MRAALEARGLQVFHQPLIELQPRAEPDPAQRAILQQLDLYQHVIFISTNAVHYGMAWLEDYWPQWPVGLHWYAVGSGTARALSAFGIQALVPERDMNSEGLLRLPPLRDLHGQRVLIVKGEGGRLVLRDETRRRGARVDQLACYRRAPVRLPAGEMAARLAEWRADLLLLSSGEGLDNLLALLSPEETSKLGQRATLLVPSRRVAQAAEAAGLGRVRVAENASDEAMLQAVERWLRDSGDD
ncbi:uroporphyrinogen-III synthase [Parahaliea mediterranea]|uniref:uroporphyrinogen-III synthase n=1 Tax=Parahaliea mediterranea TaxID=651086 RepID=UPI001F496CDF|nr:uroporphyrinogen-III synthase [Parahaliea mediterranea]